MYIYIDLLFRRQIIIQPSRPDKSCVSWPSGNYQFAQVSKQILIEFDDFGVPRGSFWAPRGMPEATLKYHGSSHAKCLENVTQIADRGRLWEHIGALKGELGRPWAQLHVVLAAAGGVFDDLFGKVCL